MRVRLKLVQQQDQQTSDPRSFAVTRSPFYIGSDRGCHLRCDNREVSPRHAVLMIENESIAIHDLNSATGTFVDEAKVLGRCTLSSGSVLRIGPFHLELLIGDAESRFATAGSSADQVGNEKLDGDITEMLVRADESERQERMQDPSSRKFVLTNSDVGESSQDDSEAQPEPESPQDALRRRLPPKRRKPGKLPPDHAKQQAANGDDSTEAANDMLRKLFGGE